MANLSLVAGVSATLIRISPSCPSDGVTAGTVHDFDPLVIVSLQNETGAEIPAILTLTIGSFGNPLTIKDEELTITAGSNRPASFKFDYEMTLIAGHNTIKFEVTIKARGDGSILVASEPEFCNFLAL